MSIPMKREESEMKLSAYVDESGQDTSGIFFIVSVVVFGYCDRF
jgi:hypothetical protein